MGPTGPGCDEQELPVRPWKLIYAAHADNALDWRGMISFETYFRRASSRRQVEMLAMVTMTCRSETVDHAWAAVSKQHIQR